MNIGQCIKKVNEVSGSARNEFSGLTIAQLNWKPQAKKWSIAQCFEHLIVANSLFFPIFDSIIAQKYNQDLWAKVSPFSSLFGKVLIRTMQPDYKGKLKTSKVFEPAQSSIKADIIERFIDHNQKLCSYFNELPNPDDYDPVIHSPASYFITYKLSHAAIFISVHEERHLLQALHVKSLLPDN